MAVIAVLGTLDTKGAEHAFVAQVIRARGHEPCLIDVGVLEPPTVSPDVSREAVAAAAGIDWDSLGGRGDRGPAVAAMAQAAALLLPRLMVERNLAGIISLGGSGGTAIATAAMRALPLGFPKVMVSTLAAGNVAPYVGVKDIVMFPSIVDVAGINQISRLILTRAAGAICGMVETRISELPLKPVVLASMFGNTTQCVLAAKKLLEAEGYEVLVFHATGTGGRVLESLVEAGLAQGVLDVTTTEWADELVGGVLNAGPDRLSAAATHGVPAIIAPGCLDMVNFGPPETVPAKFNDRTFYQHNPQITLMRTTPEECAQLGRILAEKINPSRGPVTVLLPLRAISVISAPGQKFHDPAADQALFSALKQNLDPRIPVVELDCAINDPAFAEACARTLLAHMRTARAGHHAKPPTRRDEQS